MSLFVTHRQQTLRCQESQRASRQFQKICRCDEALDCSNQPADGHGGLKERLLRQGARTALTMTATAAFAVRATLIGPLNSAAVPIPSLVPVVVPPLPPATVVTVRYAWAVADAKRLAHTTAAIRHICTATKNTQVQPDESMNSCAPRGKGYTQKMRPCPRPQAGKSLQ